MSLEQSLVVNSDLCDSESDSYLNNSSKISTDVRLLVA
jgi:hypothetical protein